MATSSILGGERAASRATGRDTDALGPSDSSDTGSDVQGERGFDALDEGEIGGDRADLASDTDASGTGERGSAVHDTDIVDGADISTDRIGVFEAEGSEDEEGDIDLEALDADIDSLSDDASPDADDPDGDGVDDGA